MLVLQLETLKDVKDENVNVNVKDDTMKVKDDTMTWKWSEFCDHVNENVDMNDEDKPKVDTVDDVLESAPLAPPGDDDAAIKDDAKAAIKAFTQ